MATVDIDLGAYKLGWHDSEDEYIFKPEKGLNEEIIRTDVRHQGRARMDARVSAQGLQALPRQAHAHLGWWRRASTTSTSTTSTTTSSRPKGRPRTGTWSRKRFATPTRSWVSPKRNASIWPASRPSTRARSSTTATVKTSKHSGCSSVTWTPQFESIPDLVREYFGTIIPPNDNKFAALNSAVWSGGSFIYVPPGVRLDEPLQAYFRINSQNMGQFERTLIIVDEDAFCHYVEGCSAPVWSSDSLHSAVVEIVVKKGGRCRYTTIQNWSNNVYNLVTKRAAAYANATMEWIDGNLGSKLTMKYPAVWMLEPGAHGEVLSIAFAGEGQHQDAGAKMVHAASDTTSTIVSKSISKGGGRAGYRGLVRVEPGAERVKSFVRCDALILDADSRSDTYPYMEIEESDAEIGHEASVSKVGDEQLFYLMSRGLSEEEATSMVVAGFIEPIVRELPMEYAVEMNRLIELNMAESGAVG